MPGTNAQSKFAAKFKAGGGAAVHAKVKDEPAPTSQSRLPAGIQGVARLRICRIEPMKTGKHPDEVQDLPFHVITLDELMAMLDPKRHRRH